ncbi:MAG: CAP domain-containing protein [Proteobacteria bacterium]|nr:CAP domain-containing protein [Pseudomonadota bacterium]
MRSDMVLAWASLLLLACASNPKQIGKDPAWRQGNRVDQTVRAPRTAELAPLIFAPSGAAVTFYNDPLIEPAPPHPLGDAIVRAIASHHARTGSVSPKPDGRLYRAAAELAAVVPEDAPLAYPLIEFALQRNGIIEPSPHILVIWGPLNQPQAIIDKLSERLPAILGAGTFTRVGIGSAVRKKDGEGVAILALQSSYLTTKPIPRELPTGGDIVIEGRIDSRYRKPEVFVTREDGSVDRPRLRTRRSGAFRTEIPCTRHQGRQQIEITAIDASGSNVLANFPVWCNRRAPMSVTIEPTIDDTADITEPGRAEELMFELVNRDRKKHGLPPLASSPRVAAVSRAHSQDMQQNGFVAHVSPTTGSAADRVRAARIRTSVVLENVARAYGVAEAQAGLMNSPGHRANLLSDLVTHIGIGIAFGEEVAGRRELFVTQVFTRVPPMIALDAAKKRIQRMLRSRSRLLRDKSLADLAQEYARSLATGLPSDETARRMAQKLETLANRYRRVTSAITTVTDIETFDVDTLLNDKRVTHYGLGLARVSHEEQGEGAIFIVILLGQAR